MIFYRFAHILTCYDMAWPGLALGPGPIGLALALGLQYLFGFGLAPGPGLQYLFGFGLALALAYSIQYRNIKKHQLGSP